MNIALNITSTALNIKSYAQKLDSKATRSFDLSISLLVSFSSFVFVVVVVPCFFMTLLAYSLE